MPEDEGRVSLGSSPSARALGTPPPRGSGTNRKLRIGFVHPDLGVGGAERLVVDAALALQDAGHEVALHTTHHDPRRCFEETRDGTLVVRTHDSWIPADIAGRLRAPCAIARTLAAARQAKRENYDLVICDLVAQSVPLVRSPKTKTLFYCHYPDSLLSPHRSGVGQLYRVPIDRSDRYAVSCADRVLVNSRFTQSRFAQAYPGWKRPDPQVLYPSVDIDEYASCPALGDPSLAMRGPLFLALHRFEEKKGVDLAIEAFARLLSKLDKAQADTARLVIAGGYDPSLSENVNTLARLRHRAKQRGLTEKVDFELNIDHRRKMQLYAECLAVVFTPIEEHFGYVPIEAMAAGRPVIVADSGGPLETVVDGLTGFVRRPEPQAFAEPMLSLVQDADLAGRIGVAGRARTLEAFSSGAFASGLLNVVEELCGEGSR